MASSHSDKEWLRKSIEDGCIQFYAYYDFIESRCIGMGRYGAVFKAKVKTLDRIVAYKPLHSENEDEMFENVVKQVSSMIIICTLDILDYLDYTSIYIFSLRFFTRSTILTSFGSSEWARVSALSELCYGIIINIINTNIMLFKLKDPLSRYVMVFEYANNGSLRHYLLDASVELDWLTRCKLGINIIEGLRYLHELDILHKNLVTIFVVIQ